MLDPTEKGLERLQDHLESMGKLIRMMDEIIVRGVDVVVARWEAQYPQPYVDALKKLDPLAHMDYTIEYIKTEVDKIVAKLSKQTTPAGTIIPPPPQRTTWELTGELENLYRTA